MPDRSRGGMCDAGLTDRGGNGASRRSTSLDSLGAAVTCAFEAGLAPYGHDSQVAAVACACRGGHTPVGLDSPGAGAGCACPGGHRSGLPRLAPHRGGQRLPYADTPPVRRDSPHTEAASACPTRAPRRTAPIRPAPW
ncbi:hypothetical protein Asi02nite_28030 [Asanoa siamensis]|uniref:Uncharacterized protein n=1 Tax=Asanoa siamensis TaxID=926357 RepID=A0ABQ4CPT7_9ACTN|nr:hypothetical protein Asi02nite_28030 [Asanoa siamensis]